MQDQFLYPWKDILVIEECNKGHQIDSCDYCSLKGDLADTTYSCVQKKSNLIETYKFILGHGSLDMGQYFCWLDQVLK